LLVYFDVKGELKYSKFPFGVEVDFKRIGILLEGLSDCEESMGVSHRR